MNFMSYGTNNYYMLMTLVSQSMFFAVYLLSFCFLF